VALALVAVCSVPISAAVVSHFRLPAAPVVGRTAPLPPQDLLGYWQATTVPDLEAEAAKQKPPKEASTKPRHSEAAVVRSAAIRGIVPAVKNASATTSVSAPEISAPPIPNPISRAAERATLRIEIDSTVGDGALAIFADQTLLFTTELHATAANRPIRLEHALPVGPHQLRVALYRADKSLQVAKEGLGEIRTDTSNALHVHVAKRSKFVVKRETSLDVSWPSAVAPAAGGETSAKLSASTK
jgi:hypothetical protein